MAIINPINLTKWLPGTPILSEEARSEFMNIYNLVNGNIDADNMQSGAITQDKLADGAVTGAKLGDVAASKVVGRLSSGNMPLNVFNTEGGTVTGTIVFDIDGGTPLLKNYDDEPVILYEGGTGDNKIRILIGGENVMRIMLGDNTLLTLGTDGLLTPAGLRIPVDTPPVTP